jgi:hypothetical protein
MKKFLLRLDALSQMYMVQYLIITMSPWIFSTILICFHRTKSSVTLFCFGTILFFGFFMAKIFADELMVKFRNSSQLYNQWLFCYKHEFVYILRPLGSGLWLDNDYCTLYEYNYKTGETQIIKKHVTSYFWMTKFAPVFDWQIKKYKLEKKEVGILLDPDNAYLF